MDTLDPAAIAAMLLAAPAWARHCLSVDDLKLRDRAAHDIAASLYEGIKAYLAPPAAVPALQPIRSTRSEAPGPQLSMQAARIPR